MSEPANYPLAPFVDALRTVVGRVMLAFFAMALGAYLGGMTATETWSGGLAGVSDFHNLVVASLFFSVGIIALPATLLFVIVFVRSEWPLLTVILATLLMWWNTHKTIYWSIHESAAAQMQKRMDAVMEQANKKLEDDRKQKDAEKAE